MVNFEKIKTQIKCRDFLFIFGLYKYLQMMLAVEKFSLTFLMLIHSDYTKDYEKTHNSF